MPILSLAGIKRAKGEEEKANIQNMHPVEPAPKGIAETSTVDTIEWFRALHAKDLKEKGLLSRDQDMLMISVLNLHATIGRGVEINMGRNK